VENYADTDPDPKLELIRSSTLPYPNSRQRGPDPCSRTSRSCLAVFRDKAIDITYSRPRWRAFQYCIDSVPPPPCKNPGATIVLCRKGWREGANNIVVSILATALHRRMSFCVLCYAAHAGTDRSSARFIYCILYDIYHLDLSYIFGQHGQI
jgi:hypothetical protein